MKTIAKTVFDRLKEPSTYRGLAILAGILGVTLSPEQTTAIIAASTSVIGLIEVFRKETQAK